MQRTCCEKQIYVFNSWSEASAVGSGVFSDTFRCFSLLSMKHPGAFCLRVCMWLVYCRPVCVICSCPLMRWRSAVPKGLFPVFSSEIFVAFYSLIKPAGLPWAGCVWGALSRWGRGRVCVCVSLLNSCQHSQRSLPDCRPQKHDEDYWSRPVWLEDRMKRRLIGRFPTAWERAVLNGTVGWSFQERTCDRRLATLGGGMKCLHVFGALKGWCRYEAVAKIQDGRWWPQSAARLSTGCC